MVFCATGDGADAAAALANLCRATWLPLYVYARRLGRSAHDAEDLVQGFFEELLRRDILAHADRERGRFRTFLLTALRIHIHHEHERATAIKRGGASAIIAIDPVVAAEVMDVVDRAALSPDQAYDRSWSLALLDRALWALQAEQERIGRGRFFERVKPFLQPGGAVRDYRVIASEFSLSENAVAVAVHRLSVRFKELVRTEVAETLASPVDVESEMRHLAASLGST
jgi:RNA polymerase sigma-70 factor (ECF subfamily)